MKILKIIFATITLFFMLSYQSILANELTSAIENNDTTLVRNLIKNGFDLNKKNELGQAPLHIACALGKKDIVLLLLDAGADVNILENQTGASPLHKAAQSGVVEIAKLLLEHGAFINLQAPTHGHTPLIDAVWHEKPEMVIYLLKHGANPDILASDGSTAMEWAIRTNNPNKFTSILNKYEKNSLKNELIQAVKKGDLDNVKKTIKKGEDINQRDSNGLAALHIAALENKNEIAETLLKAGANPNIFDKFMKSTPMHKAAYMGHAKVLETLIKYHADINAQGPYNGYTPLHDAIWHNHKEAVKVLLDNGAKLNLKTHNGKTPLELAKELGFKGIEREIKSQSK